MDVIGNVTIYASFALSLYALIALTIGIKKQNQRFIDSGKGATFSVFLLTAIAVAIMLTALATSQFKFEFVAMVTRDRKSTRLNSSHVSISYAVFCLKKKIQHI